MLFLALFVISLVAGNDDGCGRGYYSVYPSSDSCECEICPIGTYNSDIQSDSCTPCRTGLTTYGSGKEYHWYCIEPCGLGRYSVQTGRWSFQRTCRSCPIGTYSDSETKYESCYQCLDGTTTSRSGSRSQIECSYRTCANGCSKGYYYPNSCTSCEPCPIGTYNTEDNYKGINCKPCFPNWITPQLGADNIYDCFPKCGKNNYAKRVSPIEGFWQCRPCPTGSFTNTDSAKSCTRCPKGTYLGMEDNESKCFDCPPGSTTEGSDGGISLEDCIGCPIWYKWDNVSRDCEICPTNQTSKDGFTCERCPENQRRWPGDAFCECVPDHMLVGNDCEYRCGIGQIFNFDTSQCEDCPDHSTTTEANYDECQCAAGYAPSTGSSNSCVACLRGWYKGNISNVGCTQCPAGTTTYFPASTSLDDCM